MFHISNDLVFKLLLRKQEKNYCIELLFSVLNCGFLDRQLFLSCFHVLRDRKLQTTVSICIIFDKVQFYYLSFLELNVNPTTYEARGIREERKKNIYFIMQKHRILMYHAVCKVIEVHR